MKCNQFIHLSVWLKSPRDSQHIALDTQQKLLMIDIGNLAKLALLNLTMHFDTVSYHILLKKLKYSVGITGSAFDCFILFT